MRREIAGLACGLLMSVAPMASAALIDFQSESVGSYPGDTANFTVNGIGVSFSAGGLNIRDLTGFGFPGGSDRVLSSSTDSQPITLQFLNGATVNNLNFRNWISGVYTSEVDTIMALAYDASDNLLGSVTSTDEFITLGFNGIAKVVFDDVNSGYVLDEIGWRSQNVPEPGTLPLLAFAIAGLGLFSRRHALNQ